MPSELLIPLLETVSGLSANQARINLLQYFEGGSSLKRYMSRINHEFHDQSSVGSDPVNEFDPSAASEVDVSLNATSTPFTAVRVPSPPALNLRRMIEGTHLALALGTCFNVALLVLELTHSFICRRYNKSHRVCRSTRSSCLCCWTRRFDEVAAGFDRD
jgi:hypothetical protein